MPPRLSVGNVGALTTGNIQINPSVASWSSFNYNLGNSMSSNNTPSGSCVFRHDGTEIVRIEKDGSVTWKSGIYIDEAAIALGKSLSLSAEISIGITNTVKQKMRDTVFEEMISLVKEKGTLDETDLTYLWQAAKIMDKLKGGKE
jgi:hypothetical protein